MSITHATIVTVPDDGTSPVGTDEWNAPHVVDLSAADISGLPSIIEHLDPLTTTPEALINALIAHGYIEA